MNRNEFRELARVRLAEAKVLLDGGYVDGAYYLSGYAIECALKACIARQTRRYDFPPRPNLARDMYTHNVRDLVFQAGLREELGDMLAGCTIFERHWTAVRDWSEESRYVRSWPQAATGLYVAITDRRHGVLRWLRQHW